MNNFNIKKNKEVLKELLSGDMSDDNVNQVLSDLEAYDFELIETDEELRTLFDKYKQKNVSKPSGYPVHTETEKKELWSAIIEEAQKDDRKTEALKETLNHLFTRVADIFHLSNSKAAFSLVSAALAIMIIIPSILYYNSHKTYTGIKGEKTLKAKIMYSLYENGNSLKRVDNILYDGQKLAFRIVAEDTGYYSLYVVNNAMKDNIFENQHITSGTHDLKKLYTLSGNKGKNTIILFFSNKPVIISKQKMELLLNKLNNSRIHKISIEERSVYIYYNSFIVGE